VGLSEMITYPVEPIDSACFHIAGGEGEAILAGEQKGHGVGGSAGGLLQGAGGAPHTVESR
jgi:hypothetical protein